MFNISSYLQKLTKNLSSSEFQIKQIVEILNTQTGLHVKESQIEIKNFVILFTGSMGEKNKLFLSKQQILEELNNDAKITITDIR
jgi:hypothetical protein